MRKKLLFIVPPCVALSELIPEKNKTFSNKIRKEVPLGALSLATYIKYHTQSSVSVLDLNLKFYDLIQAGEVREKYEIEAAIKKYILQLKSEEFDFCGISAIFSPSYSYLGLVSQIVREVFPNALVATGGGVPGNLSEEVFADAPCIDVISYGEGELALLGLILSENEQGYIEKSPSLITREKQQKGFRPSFEFIENLDEIPSLDFSLIEFEKYSSHVHSQDGRKAMAMPLMFSRGCPFQCCFCASHSVHGRKVRYNSLKRIKSDVRLSVEKYHVNTITVWDDNFFVDKQQALELLDFFMELDLKMEFVNGFPVYRMDDDMAKRLKKSGIEVVTLAIESGSSRVLKEIIHKPLKLEMVPKAIEILNKYDIYVKGLFVIGFPGETMDDIQTTVDFIHSSDLNWVDIFVAQPLPGSELYDICKAGGYLKSGDLDQCNFWSGNIETEYFTAEEIENIQVYHTIKKDFVNNLDMQNENWERALVNFEYVINAKHQNPFAYFYASKASKMLGRMGKAEEYFQFYQDIRKNNKNWEYFFQKFMDETAVFSDCQRKGETE